MKQPLPTPPSDAPPGTISLSGALGWFSISLHVTADELDPNAVSLLFNVEPTHSQSRGVPLLNPDGSIKRTPKFGRWTLQVKSPETDEWDIEEVIIDLLAPIPRGIEVWREVESLGRIHLSLGLSLNEPNQGFSFSPSFLAFLGERHIGMDFDIYSKDYPQ